MLIKPASELRNNFTGISKLVKDGETVFLTRNGSGDMVVMSQANYDKLTNMLALYAHLADGKNDIAKGRVFTSEEVFAEVRSVLDSYAS